MMTELLVTVVTGGILLPGRAEAAIPSQWYEGEEGLTVACDAAEGIVIAVIDTGVDMNHTALRNCLWVNEAEQNGKEGEDDDGNGFVDDVHGYNVWGGNSDITDSDGHGTHVTGILGMQTEQGRNFGYGAHIMIVKAGNSRNGFSAENCVKAIQYAVQNGADVITMSLGGDYLDTKLEKAIHEASRKAVIVAAAGNESAATGESGFSDSANTFPAGLSDVLGVMAYDSDRELAWFSNWDYAPGTAVDYEVAAPGVDIYSTWPGDRFQKQSGTSMAAPIAAGACGALVRKWKENGKYEPSAMIGQLVFTADQFVRLTDQKGEVHSFPRINLEKALETTPQPRLHIRNITADDSIKWGRGNEKDGIPRKGESFQLPMEIFNLWAGAEDIRLCVATDNEYVAVKLPEQSMEFLAGRASMRTTDEQNAVITFSDDMEKGQSVCLDITLRYRNGYTEDGKEYITTGKLLLKEGEKEILYCEEQFGQEPLPELNPEVSETPESEITPEVSGTPEPDIIPEVSETPEPRISPEVSGIPAPKISPEVSEAPEAKITSEVSGTPTPDLSPAVQGTQKSVTKTAKKRKRILVKKNAKRLIVITEAKAKIIVKIYPENRIANRKQKGRRYYIYQGKADKNGRYVLKTGRIKKKCIIEVRVCKKGKTAAIQKWRLSC
mgnify:CR=1 FL=1